MTCILMILNTTAGHLYMACAYDRKHDGKTPEQDAGRISMSAGRINMTAGRLNMAEGYLNIA